MKTKDLCSPCTTALQCLEAGGCALSKEKHQPSRRQIIFNWLMDEDGWQTKKDGYWGGSEEVAKVDELLAVLDALPSASGASLNSGRLVSVIRQGSSVGPIIGCRLRLDDGSEVEMAPIARTSDAAQSATQRSGYERGYKYLQERLESIGYHGWAHDMDDEIHRVSSTKRGKEL